jgi:glucose/arabinose dehydrogenase/mono/diheme cytochrome c family protein
MCIGLDARSALITTRTDTSISTPSVDGVISANEYGPGNSYSYTGGGTGFGGQLGISTMYMKSDSIYLYIGFSNLGIPSDANQYLIYFHSRPGGFQPSDGEMTDVSDQGRANVTRLSTGGTERVTFFDAVTNKADFALLFNNRTNGFQALFELKGAGTNHAVVPRSASALGSNQIEFRVALSDLSMTNGSVIDFTALEISATGFLSNEGLPDPNLAGSPGFNNGGTTIYSNFHRFVTAPIVNNSEAMTNRVNATSLNLPSSPPTTATNSFSTVDAFPSVTFSAPICLRTPPGETNRLFIVEQGGTIAVITNLANPNRTVFMNIASRVTAFGGSGESGILSMDFHPGYATNGYFYIWYTASGSGQSNRLSRFQVSTNNPNAANTNSELILISQYDDCPNHNGGDVHFGPDNYLYLSLGDEGGANDNCDNNSQRIDKDFFAGIIRIDVDKKPGSLKPNHHAAIVAPTNYAIPPDNPFIGYTAFNGSAVNSNNVRTEFWAVGLRNPFRMSFDKLTGYLYVGDVGQDAREEVDIIGRGGNYGWKWREGNIATPGIGSPPAGFSNAINPIVEYSHSGASTNIGNVITGGIVYRGDGIPSLYGKYVFCDYGSGNIWALTNNGTNATSFGRLTGDSGIAGFGADPRNGDILMADVVEGVIKKLAVTTSSGSFPQTLADTGVFSDLPNLTPHAGIEPYAINVPFWSDNAIKTRWFSVPRTNLFLGFSAESLWTFPTSTVWIKHFDLEITNGVPSSKRRLETRILVKNASGDGGYGVTYRWGNSNTNATLVPDGGLDEPIVINDSGIIRTQIWHYPSRGECTVCHNGGAGFALSFKTTQMNRNHPYTGGTTNQLIAMERAGYFNSAIGSVNTFRRLEPATNTSASVESRVRSFLQANCAQCHYPGGPTPAGFDTRVHTKLSNAGIIDGILANDGGNPNRRVIVRNSLTNSMMLSRISVRGATQMPPLASNLLDTQSIALVTAWISGEAASYESYQEWQVRHFGSTNNPNAAAGFDFDGDGNNNELEFLTGTQPTNALDAWDFAMVNTDGPVPVVVLDRTGRAGYTVEATTNLLTGPWLFIDTPENAPVFSANPSTTGIPDRDATNSIERYYRANVIEP